MITVYTDDSQASKDTLAEIIKLDKVLLKIAPIKELDEGKGTARELIEE